MAQSPGCVNTLPKQLLNNCQCLFGLSIRERWILTHFMVQDSVKNKVNPSDMEAFQSCRALVLKSLLCSVLGQWFQPFSPCFVQNFCSNAGFRWWLSLFREMWVSDRPEVPAQWSPNKACLDQFVSRIPGKSLHLFTCHGPAWAVNICCSTSVQLYAAGCLRLDWMLHTEHNSFSDRKMFQVAEHEVRSNVWIH